MHPSVHKTKDRMTRHIEPLNHEMVRLNIPSDVIPIQRDIGFIVGLFKYKASSLKSIGEQFIQHFWSKNPTTVCLYLLAIYEELSASIYVSQRLIICYLIYRLKELWKSEKVEKAGMFSHPYLLIFVKIYWNYISPPGKNINDKSLLHLLGDFPKITAVEAYFVGRILTSAPYALNDLFESSSIALANDDSLVLNEPINVDPLRVFIEQQLRQFPFFEAVVKSTSTSTTPFQSFSAFVDPSLLPNLQQIVLSLVSPTAANASLNNNHLSNRNPPNQIPSPAPISRRNIINSAYGFIPTVNATGASSSNSSSNSTLPPALVKLFSNSSTNSSPLTTPTKSIPKPPGFFDSSPLEEIDKLNDITFGDGAELSSTNLESDIKGSTSDFFQQKCRSISPSVNMSSSYVQDSKRPLPNPIGTPLSGSIKRNESARSSSASISQAENDEKTENRKFAFELLQKIVENKNSSISKGHITRLLNILTSDADILPMFEINAADFEIMVNNQADVAAELLMQLHTSNSPDLYTLLQVLVRMKLSAQSMIAVSRFITSCDRNSLFIPDGFLNSYITHCIQTCEREQVSTHHENMEQGVTHRLVRMVCVFFSAVIRLSRFDVKPRLTEIQNFTTLFPHVKETSQLYKSITDMQFK